MAISKWSELVSIHKDPVSRAVGNECFGKESKLLHSSFGHVSKLQGGGRGGWRKEREKPKLGVGGLYEFFF